MYYKHTTIGLSLLVLSTLIPCLTYAVATINPNKFSPSEINNLEWNISTKNVDFNQTLHIRVRQAYQGYSIVGTNAIFHIPKTAERNVELKTLMQKLHDVTLNNKIYKIAPGELKNPPFTVRQTQKAQDIAVKSFLRDQNLDISVENLKTKKVIFIDKSELPHWAYEVNFRTANVKALYTLDAINFHIYLRHVERIGLLPNAVNSLPDVAHTAINNTLAPLTIVDGGGYGGNMKISRQFYVGFHLPKLIVMRDLSANLCYLMNDVALVYDSRNKNTIKYFCTELDPQHNNVYWNEMLDKVNGGFAPGNDALYGATATAYMLRDWYHIPVIHNADGSAHLLMVNVHSKFDNAYGADDTLYLGDGKKDFYPLSSLDVVAFCAGMLFNIQNANLNYVGQSGAIAYAFDSMTGKAVEYYATGKNDWQVGYAITKSYPALYYLDVPSKDCYGRKPGSWCSIDSASQYYKGLDEHFAAGVYNHAFYLLATTEGWNTKKAYDVFLQANRFYWMPNTNFATGACGVIKATEDYYYDVRAVKNAFSQVGIDTANC